MPRTLLVTNDFPPTVGGIQSYLRDFLATLPPEDVVVFASTQDAAAAKAWDEKAPYTVARWPRKVMLPTPATARRMAELIRDHDIDNVWFGAAAPLALMAKSARAAGASNIVASTHGHEVGWSMIPGARQALRLIGNHTDHVTYISDYTLRRFRRAFGPKASFEHLPSGVDVGAFRRPEDPALSHSSETETLKVLCISRLVPRKGQDKLIEAWPVVLEKFPNAQLVFVGTGGYEKHLREMSSNLGESIVFLGRIDDDQMKHQLWSADVFAMPARTRGYGLDVEGLGIVYLEAQAAGVPVIAGDSGGAPETVTSETGIVVEGNDVHQLEQALTLLLASPELRESMGEAGVRHVNENWTWDIMGNRLRRLLGYSYTEEV